jgi:carboxyl-terminal processing protease
LTPPDNGSPSPGSSGGSGFAGFAQGLITGAIVVVLLFVLIEPLRDAVLPETGGGRVGEAQQIIEDSYFRSVPEEQLEDGSIAGMVRELREETGDRFSHFFDAKTFKRFNQATSGQFSGVGLAVSEVPEGLRVSQVYPDTPAEKGGIEPGDLIVAVEGQSIKGEPSTASAAKIKGPPGTEVTITVEDAQGGKPKDVTLERAEVRIPAVTGRIIEDDGVKIGYVALATFSNGAHAEVRQEIERLRKKGAEGLVFDLRGNGGGLLQEAILVASTFGEDGPIVITEGRSRPQQEYEAQGDAIDPLPMAVLTNGDTASASEIVAAALQQNDLATIVGTTTFGKGTFQEIIELEDGGALDLTVGEYLTADGTSILDVGVEPDVRVPDKDASDGDDTLDEAVAIVADEVRAE